jgi:hypothetical protein
MTSEFTEYLLPRRNAARSEKFMNNQKQVRCLSMQS